MQTPGFLDKINSDVWLVLNGPHLVEDYDI